MIVQVEFFAIERANPDGNGQTGRVFKAPQQLHVEKHEAGAFFTGLGYVMAADVREIGPPQFKPAGLPDGQQLRMTL